MIKTILRGPLRTKPISTLFKEMKNIYNYAIIGIGGYIAPRHLQAIKVIRNSEIFQNFEKFQPSLNKKINKEVDIFG